LARSHDAGSGADPDQAAPVDDWEVFDLLFDHFLERIGNTVVGGDRDDVVDATSWIGVTLLQSSSRSRRLRVMIPTRWPSSLSTTG
jgi:hypothetical protein